MRKVFSSNEVSETVLVRDALLQQGMGATLLNEYSGQSAVPAFRPPAEVWVSRDEDFEKARRVVTATLATLDGNPGGAIWVCSKCAESNPQSFETCWQCAQERGRQDSEK